MLNFAAFDYLSANHPAEFFCELQILNFNLDFSSL